MNASLITINCRLLYSDPQEQLRQKFGIKADLMGLLPGRVTYVIDKLGIVQYIFNSQLRIEKYITEALRILKELKQEV